jgi:Tfp pilus assembly protein PilO
MTARDRTLLLIIAAVAALGGFWFLVLKPQRAEVQSLTGQISTQRQRLQTAQATVASGLAAKAEYAKDYATVAELGKAVPADDDLPSLLYQLDAASHGAHIDFKSINRAGGGSGATTSGSSSSTGSSTSGSTAALPPGATVGTAGLATLPFTFGFTGSFFDLQRFIAGVQGFVRANDSGIAVRGRLLTIDGVSLVPGSKGLANLQAKIAATAYLAPSSDQPSTAAAPSASTPDSGKSASTAPTTSAIAGGSN